MSLKKVVLPNKKIRWEVCVLVPGMGRKRMRRRFEKKIEAQEFLHALLSRKNKKNSSSSPRRFDNPVADVEGRTFNEEADNWIEKKGGEFTEGYFRHFKAGLEEIRHLFGHYPMSKFTPELLFNYRASLHKKGLSPVTQNYRIAIITRIANFSHKQRRINFNPCLGYEKAKEVKKEMRFWEEKDARSFLKFANDKYPKGSPKRWVYCVYLLVLETGLRARELWGLKVSDIPEEGSKFKVSRQACPKGKGFLPTKGKKFRYVPLSEGLRKEVEAFLERERPPSGRTLFASSKGTPINHHNFLYRYFAKDIVASGVPSIRFHDLRHTALTLMVKRKVLLPVVQKIAGHQDITTTMRYVHVLGEDVDAVAAYGTLAV